MKRTILALTMILALACASQAEAQSPPEGLAITLPGGELRVVAVTERILHVTFLPPGSSAARQSLIVVDARREPVAWQLQDDRDRAVLITGALKVTARKDTGALTFSDAAGQVLLSEPASGGKSARRAKVAGEDVWRVRQGLELAPGEALYGLGQFQNGWMNYRGRKLLLAQINTVAVNPMLVSTRGWGLLWDNYSKTEFADGKAGADGRSIASWSSEVADGIDYYFIYGPELDRVVAGYRELTGAAPLNPKWAYGYFQSKERYQSFDELIEVVKEYRRRNVPLDTIVQDWQYWGALGWNPLKFDESIGFADPARRIQEIHDLNAHIIISIWPNVTDRSEVHAELDAAGHLLKPAPLTMDLKDRSHIYDAYSPEARAIYWKHVRRNIFDQGMDGFWMDATEPESGLRTILAAVGLNLRAPSLKTASVPGFYSGQKQGLAAGAIKGLGRNELGSFARYLNTYALMTTGGVYNNWRASGSDKRVYILTRSAFAGSQRNAATTWSGDIFGRWPVLKNQIAGGINFCMAGIPYWTTDIGGFFTEKNPLSRTKRYEDPAYRELYVRWFQFGAFCPIFRSHGTNTPREVWRFGEPGEETYDTLVKFDNLRYRLMPYIYSLAGKVTQEGYTIMRGLAMDFRGDAKVYNIADQYMFGPALLACPVTEPKADSREVYLPQAAGWFDFWTGEKLAGGRTVTSPAPLSIMPLYARAGAIVPMGPRIQYAAEKSDPIEVRIYPGADGVFTLYEDEGDSYRYEQGAYATIAFTWNDSARALTIGARKGAFPGMAPTRTFNLVIVGPDHGAGEAPTASPDRSVNYRGDALTVEFP
jgi:alpha-D-xyloside xylohydrolase